jgi:hypothetical protein
MEMEYTPIVVASEAKQSRVVTKVLDCFVAPLLATTVVGSR